MRPITLQLNEWSADRLSLKCPSLAAQATPGDVLICKGENGLGFVLRVRSLFHDTTQQAVHLETSIVASILEGTPTFPVLSAHIIDANMYFKNRLAPESPHEPQLLLHDTPLALTKLGNWIALSQSLETAVFKATPSGNRVIIGSTRALKHPLESAVLGRDCYLQWSDVNLNHCISGLTAHLEADIAEACRHFLYEAFSNTTSLNAMLDSEHWALFNYKAALASNLTALATYFQGKAGKASKKTPSFWQWPTKAENSTKVIGIPTDDELESPLRAVLFDSLLKRVRQTLLDTDATQLVLIQPEQYEAGTRHTLGMLNSPVILLSKTPQHWRGLVDTCIELHNDTVQLYCHATGDTPWRLSSTTATTTTLANETPEPFQAAPTLLPTFDDEHLSSDDLSMFSAVSDAAEAETSFAMTNEALLTVDETNETVVDDWSLQTLADTAVTAQENTLIDIEAFQEAFQEPFKGGFQPEEAPPTESLTAEPIADLETFLQDPSEDDANSALDNIEWLSTVDSSATTGDTTPESLLTEGSMLWPTDLQATSPSHETEASSASEETFESRDFGIHFETAGETVSATDDSLLTTIPMPDAQASNDAPSSAVPELETGELGDFMNDLNWQEIELDDALPDMESASTDADNRLSSLNLGLSDSIKSDTSTDTDLLSQLTSAAAEQMAHDPIDLLEAQSTSSLEDDSLSLDGLSFNNFADDMALPSIGGIGAGEVPHIDTGRAIAEEALPVLEMTDDTSDSDRINARKQWLAGEEAEKEKHEPTNTPDWPAMGPLIEPTIESDNDMPNEALTDLLATVQSDETTQASPASPEGDGEGLLSQEDETAIDGLSLNLDTESLLHFETQWDDITLPTDHTNPASAEHDAIADLSTLQNVSNSETRETSGLKTTPKARSAKVSDYHKGQTVEHPQYGHGVIEKVLQMYDDQIVLNIHFDSVGKRLLDPELSHLTHLSTAS